VCGFSAAMVTGPFVGHLADRFGIRLMIVLGYCVVYALGCVTKHFGDSLPVLYLGRVLGGTATSVLFSCFESWLVAEYMDKGQSSQVISQALGRMYFVNGATAVVMGLLSQLGADAFPLTEVGSSGFYYGGDTVPFDMSFGVLLVGLVLVQIFWGEKYKEVSTPESRPCTLTLWIPTEAVCWMAGQPLALILMLGSACTEAAMYAFVIEWTPALSSDISDPPEGLVFTALMLAYMAGSILAGWASFSGSDSVALLATTAVGAITLGIAAILTGLREPPLAATYMTFVSFCVYEACVGAYFALVGSIKAKQIPEHLRAAIYGIFRVPLNVLVVIIQLLSPSTSISMLSASLLCLVSLICFIIVHCTIFSNRESVGAKQPLSTEASPLKGP